MYVCNSKASIFCGDLSQPLVLLPLPNKNKRKEKTQHTHLLSMVHNFLLDLSSFKPIKNQDFRLLGWKSLGVKREKSLWDCCVWYSVFSPGFIHSGERNGE